MVYYLLTCQPKPQFMQSMQFDNPVLTAVPSIENVLSRVAWALTPVPCRGITLHTRYKVLGNKQYLKVYGLYETKW